MEKMKKGGMPWKKEVLYASGPVPLSEASSTKMSFVGFLGDYFQQMYDFAIDLIKWLDRVMGPKRGQGTAKPTWTRRHLKRPITASIELIASITT